MLENGTETFDREEIRQKWKRDFEQLFNERLDVDGDIEFDDEFLMQSEQLYSEWDNRQPNEDIMMDNDVWYNLLNAPLDKAVGVNNLPNEILKHPHLLALLHRIFCSCFDNNVIPSVWYKSIICPVLKKDKDSRYPANYRAISS